MNGDAERSPSIPLPGPIASARDRPWPLVGRTRELEAIHAAWSRVYAGGRETILVAGELGAGKSRLVAEAGEIAHRDGGLVLYGSGEETDATPYGPFVAAVGHLDRHAVPGMLLDDLRDSPLGRLIPGAARGDDHAGHALGDDRGRLFAATVDQLERAGEHHPVLLIVDDLHDCGHATLLLVEHLARAHANLRLLLIATYRPTDLDPEDERTAVVAELRSSPAAQHFQLEGLGVPELRDIAASLGVAEGSDALDRAARLVERDSGGNPLFACELLRAIGDDGYDAISAAPPRSLRMLIAARAQALGAGANAHLSAASACGRDFDAPVVAAALELTEPEFAGSIARAERAGLLTIDRDGGCRFTHAITASCLYEELGPARRGPLHRRLAETLESGGGSHAELARHWRHASPPDDRRAAQHAAIAGTEALERYDHEVAAHWFEQALELHDRGGRDVAPERCDLLIGLGRALRFTDQERSRTVLLEASRLADELDDVGRLVAAALANHRGFVSLVGGYDRERGAMLAVAAERLTVPGPVRALVLAQLALELTFSPDVARRRALSDEALAAARASGDQRVLAQVLIRHLIAHWGPETPRERVAEAAESVAISAQLDEPLDLFHGLYWQAGAQIELCRIADAAQTLHELERIAERIGDITAIWLCECSASVHLALRGQLAEAEARAQHAAELARRSSQPDMLPFYISQVASIRWQQGRLPELAPLLAQALEENPGLPVFRSLVTLAYALGGDAEQARAILAIDTASGFAELPRDPVWLAGAVTYAHAIAELGDADAAALLFDSLDPYRGQLATTTISVWGLVDHALGRLELLLGRTEEGRASLRRAIDDYAWISAPLWREQAERDLGADAPPPSEVDARIAALGLTARQVEVVRLVARGRSNKDIAAELQVSPSTVKRHLENAYDRTGARSRSALIALLLDPGPAADGATRSV